MRNHGSRRPGLRAVVRSAAIMRPFGGPTRAVRIARRLLRPLPPTALLLPILAAIGVQLLATSTRWGVRKDVPLLMYPARLAWRGIRVPFRDVVDMNQPGSYLVYGALDFL